MSGQATFIAAVSSYVVAALGAQSPAIVLKGDCGGINYGLDFLALAVFLERGLSHLSSKEFCSLSCSIPIVRFQRFGH